MFTHCCVCVDFVDPLEEVAAARNGNRCPFFPHRYFPIVDMIVDVYFVENRIIVEKVNNNIDQIFFMFHNITSSTRRE